jgi:hypothetical protein
MTINPEDLDPELAEKLQARVDLINLLEDRFAKGEDIGPLLDQVDDVRHARGLVMALLVVRAGDREKLRQVLGQYDERELKRQEELEALRGQVRDHAREEMRRALEAPDLETARLRIMELEDTVADQQRQLASQEELITALRWLTGH